MNKAKQFLLHGLLLAAMLFAVLAFGQDTHTTGQFQGPKANKGYVTTVRATAKASSRYRMTLSCRTLQIPTGKL